jgi:signal transduction histidine kinase
MRGLVARIALIFFLSMCSVLVIATAVTSFVLSSGDAARSAAPMARHIASTSDMLLGKPPQFPFPPDGDKALGDKSLLDKSLPDKSPGDKSKRDFFRRIPPGEIVTALPAGEVQPDQTKALQAALAKEGENRPVSVIDTGEGEPVAALTLDDGRWMLFSYPKPMGPPPELAIAAAAWLTLFVIGIVVVALIMAYRVTRPFVMLDEAVRSVGPDGVLPHTPEVGSGEARRTAAALNALSDRLRAAMESRMRLVAAAGHDFRTPMTRMRLRVEFMPDDEERDRWLADLDELDAIADSAIKLVREEGTGEDRTPLVLEQLVRETVEELQVAQLPVTLGTLDSASVMAGPLALRRALRNLITNAATHGGGARVKLEKLPEDTRIVIEDDGPGIPEAMLSQVFEPFFRANPARTQAIKGAGLGLAIAREIIERFGGTIEIRNRPEGGLEQVVRLKAVAAAG